MASINQPLQKLAREYKRELDVDVIDLDKITDWVLRNKKWEPDPLKIRRVFKELMANALREEYETDPQGRRVRINHRVSEVDSKGKQMSIWGDNKTAPKAFLHKGFQLRRRQVFGDCRQLMWDVDSVNENRFADDPIPMQYDFNKELKESELVRLKEKTSSIEKKQPSSRFLGGAGDSTSSPAPVRP